MWLELLKNAVAKSSKQAVAMQLGVSRTTISLVCSGQYPAKTDKIEKLVLEAFGSVQCPHLDREISLNECRTNHQSAVPTSSPRAMKLWQACQGCPHNHQGSGHANANS